MTNFLLNQPMIFNFLIVIFLGIFLIALFRAQKANKLDWVDMLTRDGSKVSTTKILQLIGGIVGTWVIIKTTSSGDLTWDIFAIYLAYVASIDGFSKFILAKYGASGSDDSKVPYKKNTNGENSSPNSQKVDKIEKFE